MGYDKELTLKTLGDPGPLRFNPWVIKVCQGCQKPEKKRYKGAGKPTAPYHCRSCVVNRPEVKSKLSEATTEQWKNPEFRDKVVTNSTKIWLDDDLRNKMSAFRNSDDFKDRMLTINRTKLNVNSGLSQEEFLKRAVSVWSDTYDYSDTVYVRCNVPITVSCRMHGQFNVVASYHLNGSGCPKCAISRGQFEILDHIQRSIPGSKVLINDRKVIGPYELDVYLPDFGVAFEYNGSYYHSHGSQETPKQKDYHRFKTALAEKRGIKLVHIAEHDWLSKPELIRSMIGHKLGLSDRIYARKLDVRTMSHTESGEFFNKSHLKGGKAATVCYSLWEHGGPVTAMSFTKHGEYWEIERYATSPGLVVVGGASKMFKAFLRQHSPNEVRTYADRSISDAGVYLTIGFKHAGYTKPGYFYLDSNLNRYSRVICQKHRLPALLGDGFDSTLSESVNMFKCGYRRMWDSGNHKLIWSRSSH